MLAAVAGKTLYVFADASLLTTYELSTEPIDILSVCLPGMHPRRDFLAVISPRTISVFGVLDVKNPSFIISPIAIYTVSSPVRRNDAEREILLAFMRQEATADEATQRLIELRDSGTSLSVLAQQFLSLESPASERNRAENFPYPSAAFAATDGLGFNRARLLDGHTAESLAIIDDCITAAVSVDFQQGDAIHRTICYGTENGFLAILRPDMTALFTSYDLAGHTPTQIHVEGVVTDGDAGATWRASILTRTGSILSLRGSILSRNIIESEVVPRFIYRLGKSIYAVRGSPLPGEVVRVTPRGRLEYSFRLTAEYASSCPVSVTVGRVFTGFLIALRDASVVFVNETGLASVMGMAPPSLAPLAAPVPASKTDPPEGRIEQTHTEPDNYFTAVHFGRYMRDENVLLAVTKGGRLFLRVLRPTGDLGKGNLEDTRSPLQDRPFDVEDEDVYHNDDPKFLPPSLADQRLSSRLFLAGRSQAKSTVLAQLLAVEKQSDHQIIKTLSPSNLLYSVGVEGLDGALSIAVTADNPTSRIAFPTMAFVSSPLLKAVEPGILLPSIPSRCSVTRYFRLLPGAPAAGEASVPSHVVRVAISHPGSFLEQSANEIEAVLDVQVPELFV